MDVEFLDEDPSTWHNIGSFQEVVKKVFSLSVINDTTERGVALIQDYNKLLSSSSCFKQLLIPETYSDPKQATMSGLGTMKPLPLSS